MFPPKLIEENRYRYYQCGCASWHLQFTTCPMGGMAINTVDLGEEEEDEESENLLEIQQEEEEVLEN